MIVVAVDDLEKAQILVELILVLQHVFALITENPHRGERAECTYRRKIAKVYDTSLNCLKPTHRKTRHRSLLRLVANVIVRLHKGNYIVEKLLVGRRLVVGPEVIEVGPELTRVGHRHRFKWQGVRVRNNDTHRDGFSLAKQIIQDLR